MNCGGARTLNGREITLGISESYIEIQNTINYFLLIVKCRCRCNGKIPHLRWYLTLQGDKSLRSVERFDHMMFVYRFQASR